MGILVRNDDFTIMVDSENTMDEMRWVHLCFFRWCSDGNFSGEGTQMVVVFEKHNVRSEQWKDQLIAGWWFGTFFIFPYIGTNHPNWLSYFSEGNHQPDSFFFRFCQFDGYPLVI